MVRLIRSRLLWAAPSVIGVVIVTFLLTRALPGHPAVYFAGPAATQQAIAETRHSLGLDRGLPEQFLVYIVDLAHGQLGNSLSTGQPVVQELLTRFAGLDRTDPAGARAFDRGGGALGIAAARRPNSSG